MLYLSRNKRLRNTTYIGFKRFMSNLVSGTVKWFDDEKGFGFIQQANGRDVFVHHTGIGGTGRKTLAEGQTVSFEVITGSKGLQAQNVTIK
jgi:CspA family cold shock protein